MGTGYWVLRAWKITGRTEQRIFFIEKFLSGGHLAQIKYFIGGRVEFNNLAGRKRKFCDN